MKNCIRLDTWFRMRPDPDGVGTWEVVFWQEGKTDLGMLTDLTRPLSQQTEDVWKENGLVVTRHSYNPTTMSKKQKRSYFLLDEV